MASVSWHLQPPLFPLAEHRHVESGELHGKVLWGLRALSKGATARVPHRLNS